MKLNLYHLINKFEDAVVARNKKIDEINSIPAGDYKNQLIAQFKDVDNGGWLTPSFQSQVNALNKILELFGISTWSLPNAKSLGVLPVIIAAIEGLPATAWVAGAATVTAIAGLATYYFTQRNRYEAIKVNPQGVAQADPTITGQIGEGIKYALIVVSVLAAIMVLKK